MNLNEKLTPALEQLRTSVELDKQEFTMNAFRPVAYYDDRLDCIRVIVKDCSTTEWRLDETFTLLEDNYPGRESPKWVGFCIKGVAHRLHDTFGNSSRGVAIRLSEIFDEILKRKLSSYAIIDALVRPLAKEFHIEQVEFDRAA